eukprot:GHRQ01020377.1.p1 GENE.GHRQ01020377.1~~GHRQ01020377.1.p1  ORF type:complete len:147 (+),score=2.87 GHRQ01020377.1:453-893(+)
MQFWHATYLSTASNIVSQWVGWGGGEAVVCSLTVVLRPSQHTGAACRQAQATFCSPTPAAVPTPRRLARLHCCCSLFLLSGMGRLALISCQPSAVPSRRGSQLVDRMPYVMPSRPPPNMAACVTYTTHSGYSSFCTTCGATARGTK